MLGHVGHLVLEVPVVPRSEVGASESQTGLLRPLLVHALNKRHQTIGNMDPLFVVSAPSCTTLLPCYAQNPAPQSAAYPQIFLRLLHVLRILTPEVHLEVLLQQLQNWLDAQEAAHEQTCGPLLLANFVDLVHPELIKRGFWWPAAIGQGSLLYIFGVSLLKLLLQHFGDFFLQLLKVAGFPICCIFPLVFGCCTCVVMFFVANLRIQLRLVLGFLYKRLIVLGSVLACSFHSLSLL